ncbi:MAG: hypothetical protein ACM3MD_03815 [Betaproteobacteria bacterium]
MTIWEKAVLNMQKGGKKISVVAATLSERVKAELAVLRLRIRIDEVQARVGELYSMIGRKIIDLKKREMLPKTTDQLLKDDEIMAVMAELTDREQEIEELKTEMKRVNNDFKTTVKETEDTLV